MTYAVTATRPDPPHALGTVNQFCSNPGEHWKAAKRILRYIKGTIDYTITFDGNKVTNVKLKGNMLMQIGEAIQMDVNRSQDICSQYAEE